jgi:hypothetical protein
MRAAHHRAALALIIALAATGRASAQSADRGRLRINIDAGGQFSSNTVDTTTTKPVYLENASIHASDEVRRGLLADAGVSLRIAGDFAVGVTASWFMAKNDADISASVPHPFFFRTPRTVTGTTSLRREELAAHIQAIYTIHANRSVDVALSGGPSFFQLRQDVVTDIAFADIYPYDAPTFTSASTQRVSASHIGFNAGVDVSVRLSRHAGLGGGVRFSKATIDMTVPNGGGTVSVDAGGAQAIGGLRLYF